MKDDRYKLFSKFKWLTSSIVTPISFAGTSLLILGVFLYVIIHNSKVEQSKDIRVLAERAARNIELRLKGNLDFLNLIAIERADGNVTEKTFHEHVLHFLEDHPEFINITWIDSNFVIRTVSPLKHNAHIIGLRIELPEPKRASRLARQKRESVYTKPFEAIQANSSLEVWVPVYKNNTFIGLFAGVYSCEQLLHLNIPFDKQYTSFYRLIDENGVIVSEFPKMEFRKTDISYSQSLITLANGLKVAVEMIKKQTFSWILRLLAFVSIVLVIGFSYTLWKIQAEIHARRKIEETLKINEIELKKQNTEYLVLNEELTESNNWIQRINQELLLAKEEAEKNENLLRLSTELGNVAVWEFDIIQSKLTRSKNHDNLFGLEWQNEWSRNVFLNATHPEDRELVNNTVESALAKGGPNQYTFDFRVIHPDKTVHWLTLIGHVVKRNEAGTGIILRGCLIDITYRKNYEIQLSEKNEELRISKEKAEENNRLKTAFLQNMSHEIRTPMNAIMGFSSLLGLHPDNPQKIQQFSEIINQRCHDLLDIINDILDIAKIESGQLSINIEECNLRELFEELTAFFTEYKNRIGKQQVDLYLHPQCNEEVSVIITDKVKLKQIFINLISNALKFTDEGKVEGGCKFDANHNLVFYVSDTGIGIPHDKQASVFERFVQLNSGIRKNIGGTGLGLSIVEGLINLLGGEIYLESEPGKGSTFSFNITYKIVQQSNYPTFETEIQKPENINNKTVLVVEDDLFNAKYLKEVLSLIELNILIAETGEKAIEISKKHSIDLILMDIRLPGMDGYEAILQIKKFKPGVKIIAQTAYASSDEKRKAMKAGCVDYISKPSQKNILLSTITKHLV